MFELKVKFFDKALINTFYKVLSVISVLTSIFFLFIDLPQGSKFYIGIICIIALVLIYCGLWIRANRTSSIIITINTSKLEICEGDIFIESGFKVIAFNEYFDTLVDEVLISKNTLNGKYLIDKYPEPCQLDDRIESDEHLKLCVIETGVIRRGKAARYKLGSIYKDGEFFLLAFSRFDTENRAYLEIDDYVNCMMNFWNECDIHYAGNSVVLPLLGAGLTRFHGYENMTEQEILETIIWTFKTSRIRFQYPAKAKIILTKNALSKIDLYKIKKQYEFQ